MERSAPYSLCRPATACRSTWRTPVAGEVRGNASETAGETADETAGETAGETVRETTAGETAVEIAGETARETARRTFADTARESAACIAGDIAAEAAAEAAPETAPEAAATAGEIGGESMRAGGVTAETAPGHAGASTRPTVVDVIAGYVDIMNLHLRGGIECEPITPGRDGEASRRDDGEASRRRVDGEGATERLRDGQGSGFAYVIPVIVVVNGEDTRVTVLEPARL